MGFSWFLGKRRSEPRSPDAAEAPADAATAIRLCIEDGLLMAFGPDDDPVPPSLLKDDAAVEFELEGGGRADRQRVLDVLDAQQRSSLSDHPNDQWVEAMLGLAGGFEATAPDLLANEPNGPTPALSDSVLEEVDEADGPISEWVTPLTFDETEANAMAEADAVLVRGLKDGTSLSAGRFEPTLNGWVLSRHQLPGLAIQRADSATAHVEIDVSAVSIKETGGRWLVATRQVELA